MKRLIPLLLLAGCQKPIKLNPPPPPAEHLVCEELPARPDLRPLQAFSLPDGGLAYRKADVDARDAEIAPYVLSVRGAWFSCSSQLGWVRDYYAGQ